MPSPQSSPNPGLADLPMKLMGDDELERSAVVANCRMNRERNLLGSNGYDRELGFDPLDFLKERTATGRPVAWLDLCCGTGRALIQAARDHPCGGLGHRSRSWAWIWSGCSIAPDPALRACGWWRRP